MLCSVALPQLPVHAAGIQPQTAECIVIGEITAKDLVVVLNKTGVRAQVAFIPHICTALAVQPVAGQAPGVCMVA